MSSTSTTVITRRNLLRTGALGLGTATLLGSSLAWAANAKMSQDFAAYQTTPKGKARCDACTQWEAPHGCKVVAGVISPIGWCSLFAAKS